KTMKDNDILDTVRDGFDGVHLDHPLETVVTAGRARRRRATALRTSAASLALAGLAAGALAFQGIGGPPVSAGGGGPGGLARTAGYNRVRTADGSITFTVNDVIDTAAATTALNNAGIAGRVIRLGADPACTTTTRRIDPGELVLPADGDIRALGDERQ